MPIWRPSLIAAGFDPNTILSPFHIILGERRAERGLPPPRRPARRHPADPGPVHSQRRLDRRPVPLAPGSASSCSRRSSDRRRKRRAEDARSQEPRSAMSATTALLGRGVKATDLGQRVRPATGPGIWSRGSVHARSADRPRWAAVPACPRRARRPHLRRSGPSMPPSARSSGRPRAATRSRRGSAATRTSGWPSTARSRRCGLGQLISLFGDRIHQIALAFLVFAVTDSPVAVAFVFVVATCRTCSCRRSPGRSSTAGTRRTSWSSATCCARRSSWSSRSRP